MFPLHILTIFIYTTNLFELCFFVCFFIELSYYKAKKVVPETLFIFLHLLLPQSDDTKANDGNEEIVRGICNKFGLICAYFHTSIKFGTHLDLTHMQVLDL